ncbi:hypothetical protein GGH96_000780 [Coemansia sp. RSA 1972]|nr:hypothetical protein GGH96_000780 [Coemansia sp. RSA 1972]
MKQTLLCVEQPTLLRIEQSTLSRKEQPPSRKEQTSSSRKEQSSSSHKEQPPSRKEQSSSSHKEQPTSPPHREQQRRTPRSTARPIVPREEECWPVTKLLDKYPELRFERWLPSVLRSIEKSSGAVFDERVQRGAHGNILCMWCGRECKRSGALFCDSPRSQFGDGCEHEHRMRRDGQYVRRQLFLRDSGACARCGIDTHALFTQATECRTLEQRRTMFKQLARQTSPQWLAKARRPLESLDYDFTSGMMWEAAHVIDVRHGGGLCGLDGFRTLCTPCHAEEYVRIYAQDLCDLPLSPVRTNAHGVLAARKANVVRSAPRLPAKECTPLILLDSSPSSTSSSPLLPSPNRIVCPQSTSSPLSASSPIARPAPKPPCRSNAETPTKQRGRKSNKTPVSLQPTSVRSSSVLSPPKTPTRRLAAIIDLTRPPTLVLSGDSEVDSLTTKITTFNISSSEDSADEVELIYVSPKRTPRLPPVITAPAPAPRASSRSKYTPRSRSRSAFTPNTDCSSQTAAPS